MKKTLIITTIIILSLILSAPALASTDTFDENNITLRFSVISDTHIYEKESNGSSKFKNAITELQKYNINALLINGDITDYGLPKEVEIFKTLLEETNFDLNSTKLLLSLGNHELYNHKLNGAEWTGGKLFKDILGNSIYEGATEEEILSGCYHTTINGYHFIIFHCEKYEKILSFNEKSIAWLKTELQKASESSPEKPIFFAMHPLIRDTTLGSTQGNFWATIDDTIYNILAEYPQTIAFGSHCHFPLQNELMINQKNFTAIETSSTYSLSLPKLNFLNVDEIKKIASEEHSQGLLIEVDKNNNTKITRLDFAKKEIIKEPWVIPSPTSENHLSKYNTKIRTENNTPPKFNIRTKITYIPKIKGISFNSAIDDDMVYGYEISYIDKETNLQLKTIYIYSDFYLHPKASQMSEITTLSITDPTIFEYINLDKYYIEIKAIDIYGQTSTPIYSSTLTNHHLSRDFLTTTSLH